VTEMMALRAHTRGGPETLVYETAPKPVAGPDEVVVRVASAAITFAELGWDETWTRDGHDRTPIIPSHEVSGVIDELGSGVDDFVLGDEVYGLTPFDWDGAAADFVVVPARVLARKPTTIGHTEASTVPMAALTAWQALTVHGSVGAGDRVLVHGGAGGVGVFAVQLGKSLGAQVTATVRSRDIQFARELGADRVRDFEADDFTDDGAIYDLVIDTVGGAILDRSYSVVRPGGRLITLQDSPSEEKAAEFGITALFFLVMSDRTQLDELANRIDAGTLRTIVANTFALENGRQAYASGAVHPRPPGKTVLVVNGS
jgi:NADPH:quinone reductase-like Zn-dependent oxidoreductase